MSSTSPYSFTGAMPVTGMAPIPFTLRNIMVVQAIVVQDVPAGNFEIVIKVESDADQKAIMMATPNVYFGDKQYVQEANPVHLVPGYIKLSLINPLLVSLTKGTNLTCHSNP